MAKKETPAAPVRTEAAFTKDQLAASRRYAGLRDLVAVLLEDGRTYTQTETDALLDKFRKGKVN